MWFPSEAPIKPASVAVVTPRVYHGGVGRVHSRLRRDQTVYQKEKRGVGTVLDAAICKYKGKQTGENSLFRTLYRTLQEGDVILADRCFSGWFDIALLKQRSCDAVVRKHQIRPTDFRTGERLGSNDHLVTWPKPKRPETMNKLLPMFDHIYHDRRLVRNSPKRNYHTRRRQPP
jgi:hypothetical protein